MTNGTLEKTTIDQIVTLHNQIVADLKRSLDSAIQIGQLLAEQKENLNHGEFGPWIKANLPFTDRTASYTFAGETREELLTLKQMIEDGSIRPVIDKIYLPGQATRAHERVETEQRVGIVMISMQGWLQHNQGSE